MKKPAWNARPRDANGWLIPADGTISRKIYDLAITGKSAPAISDEIGVAVTTVYPMLARLRPLSPKEIEERALVKAARGGPSPLSDVEIDKLIDAYGLAMRAMTDETAAQSIKEQREELLVLRLDRDMEKFLRRIGPKRARKIRAAYEQGKLAAQMAKTGIFATQ